MKENLHPKWYPDAKVVHEGEVIMVVGSTKPEISVDIWSGNHPFYTGQQRLVDTEGQVERFMKRLQRREEIRTEVEEQMESQSAAALPIDDIGLTTRALNSLKADDVNTVGDALERLEQGDDALLAIHGVGQKALIDIKKYLRAQGLIE
ncbi:MAG: 50S ribosomal protein L31 [Candidatus Promineifilaceae bacterium]|jgi:large subunit ribosomal protein L31